MDGFFSALTEHAFLQTAVIAALLASIGCGVMGTYVVVKRIAFIAGEITTGSHTASLRAVADGRADCAAIDHSIWDAEQRTGSAVTDRLRVIDRTTDWPAPPLLVRRGLDRPTRTSIATALIGWCPAYFPFKISTVGK